MQPRDTVGKGFVIVPNGRKNALTVAFEAFPELKDKFDGPDDEFLNDVYFVYGLLSTKMIQRWHEDLFRKRSCKFMERLAESGDPFLEELLVVCLLEKLAEDVVLAGRAKKCIGLQAAAFLSAVEREMFGR